MQLWRCTTVFPAAVLWAACTAPSADSGRPADSGSGDSAPRSAASPAASPVCGAASFGGIDFVQVCASTFDMGCTAGQTDCDPDETAHTVTLTRDYWVATTEVTQAQFEARLGFNPSLPSDCAGDCPVDWISAYHGMAFASALSAEAGLIPSDLDPARSSPAPAAPGCVGPSSPAPAGFVGSALPSTPVATAIHRS